MTGASLDVDLGPLKLFADLGVKLDGVAKELRNLRRADEARARLLPQLVPITYSAKADTAGNPLYIDCDGPVQGRRWEVRCLVVGGVTFDTTAAGKGRVLVIPSVPLAGVDPPLTAVRDNFNALPATANYGTGVMVVGEGDRLVVQIKTPTPSQVYAVGGVGWSFATRIEQLAYEV